MYNVIKNVLLSVLLINAANVTTTRASNTYEEVIDYELMYNSDIFNNTNDSTVLNYFNNNLGFSNGLIDNRDFNKTFNYTLDECKNECDMYDNCVGIFRYDNNSDVICNYLSSIEQPSIFNITSYSYLKIKHHNYNDDKSYSIKGNIYDSYEQYKTDKSPIINSTLYLDLNHNGVLEEDEPSILATFGKEFVFDNVKPGIYLIRQIVPDNCYQFYPGLYGNHNQIYMHGDGYIDNVIYFYEMPHKNKLFYGGSINESSLLDNINYSYIIGNDTNTYMTFYPENTIILSFVDETIINNDGDDIYIELYNDTFIEANVYISHNNKEYYKIGVLNNNTNSFDISNSKETFPISYIKLDFYKNESIATEKDDYMNIVSIKGNIDSLYKPAFGYYINVPDYKYRVFFYNDCHYLFSCTGYCIFNTIGFNEYTSCLYGCHLFDTTNMCDCNGIIDEQFYIDNNYDLNTINYNNQSCISGCYLSMRRYLYPNYTLFENSVGYSHYQLDTNYSYDYNMSCLNNMMETCSDENCSSFSLNNHNSLGMDTKLDYMTYMKPYYKHDDTKNMIIKNSFLDILDIPTSTSTTSTTTSETSTTTSETSTTTSETSTTTSETSTTTSETSTTTSETSTTTSETSTSTTSHTHTSTTTSNIQSINSNNNNHLYYTIPISVLCGIFLISMIIIVISTYSKNNRRQINNMSYGYANPLYADENNNNEGDNVNNEEEVDERNNDNYQDVNMNSLNTDLLYSETHTEYDDFNAHIDTSTTVKYENINPNGGGNYNDDYLHVISDNKIATDL